MSLVDGIEKPSAETVAKKRSEVLKGKDQRKNVETVNESKVSHVGDRKFDEERIQTCETCGHKLNASCLSPAVQSRVSSHSLYSISVSNDFCRICHCEEEVGAERLITPCHCRGSLAFVHHSCLQKWIKCSGYKRCELCKFQFAMHGKLKPFRQWKKLKMSEEEKRRVWCAVFFHVVSIICSVWSLYMLIDRMAHEVVDDDVHWPFYTKLAVLIVALCGGFIFMYIQCLKYYQLWIRLVQFNQEIFIQDQSNIINIRSSSMCNNNKQLPLAPFNQNQQITIL